MRICGRPKDPTAEESALAFAEKELELKRKHWQLERDQEEWAIKKRRDEEEFELRKEERKAAAAKDNLLFTLLSKNDK